MMGPGTFDGQAVCCSSLAVPDHLLSIGGTNRIVGRKPLARRVLAVAVADREGWKAYIDAVPGENHDLEMEAVAKTGVRLPRQLAERIFPGMACYKYAR